MATSFFTPYWDVPISALNASCRRKLSESLNGGLPIVSEAGYPRSWMGLAELIGLSYRRIQLLKDKEDPTDLLLSEWENYWNPTVGQLIEFLETMERYDVQDDIKTFVERDGRRYLKEKEEERQRLEAINPVQDPQVSSGDPIRYNMTVQDSECVHMTGQDEMTYNAYVSYVDSDVEFVYELKNKLEGEYKLRLFIKDRDMLGGLMETEADIKMMHERCERIILVLSPEFFSDQKCEFQTIIAQAMQVEKNMYSRKVIPLIYKPCELPMRLRYIANLNYSKQDMFGSFWNRLFKSITKQNQTDSSGNSMYGIGDTTVGGSAMQSSLQLRAQTCSIPLSPSMSSLMEIGPSPPSRRASHQGVTKDSLSPSPTPDSGIGVSMRSVSMTDCYGVGAVEMTSTEKYLSIEGPKRVPKSKKNSLTTPRWKTFFKSGNSSGHISS